MDNELKDLHTYHIERENFRKGEKILVHIQTHKPQWCKQNMRNNKQPMLVGNKAMHLTPPGPIATLRQSSLRPCYSEHARSRLISEAKQCRAWLEPGWEYPISLTSI